MATVNVSRAKMAQKLNHAIRAARLIGFDDDGHACVWSGGYGFNVYDAARDWSEIGHFTSGDLAAVTDYDSDEARQMARERMESEGFEPVE